MSGARQEFGKLIKLFHLSFIIENYFVIFCILGASLCTGLFLRDNYLYFRAGREKAVKYNTGTEYSKDFMVPGRTFPPSADTPAQNQVFYFYDTSPIVFFRWSAPENAAAVLLEIADNERFEGQVSARRFDINGNASGGSFYSSEFGEGTWYWRLTGIFAGENEENISISGIRSFRIVRDSAPGYPKLIYPGHDDTLELYEGRKIFFSWAPMQGSSSYNILISGNENMTLPVIKASTDRNYFVYETDTNLLGEGIYYWTVFRKNENAPVFNIRSFTVSKNNSAPRTVFPPDNYVTSSALSPDIFFTWKSSFPGPVIFQISERSDFSGKMFVEEKITNQASRGWFLSPGIYYWRVFPEIPVSGQTDEGQNHARITSIPSRLIILPAIIAPEVSPPVNEISPGLIVKEPEFIIEEPRVFYEEPVAAREEPIAAEEVPMFIGLYPIVSDAYSVISGRFPMISEKDIGDLNEAAMLNIPRPSITLTAPISGTFLVYNQLSPVEINWSLEEPLQNSRVIFSHNPEPSADPRAIIHYIEQGENSINLPFLGEGVWYWIVVGDTKDGKSISAAAPSWFTVLPQAPFNSPEYLKPGDESVISLEQLTLDRGITFEWGKIEGANAYIFSLFGNDKKRELLFSSAPIPDTSFTLTDLAILALDEYTWQVEAVSVTRNGNIERRGLIRQFTFSLDIAYSENLRTRSQGTSYGI